MSTQFDGQGFTLIPLTMPCCGTKATLNELAYQMDQGFSRFEIVISNGNIGTLPEAVKLELEEHLDCPFEISSKPEWGLNLQT